MQGVEWQVVQQSMGHKDQVPGIEQVTNGGDDLLIEIPEVRLRRQSHGFAESSDVLRVKAEFRHLELQEVEQFLDARTYGDGNDLQLAVREDTGNDAVLNVEVLHDGRVSGHGSADLFDR